MDKIFILPSRNMYEGMFAILWLVCRDHVKRFSRTNLFKAQMFAIIYNHIYGSFQMVYLLSSRFDVNMLDHAV